MMTMNVPPPVDEEEFRYILNRSTGTLHKWPGCRVLEYAKRNTYGFASGLKYMTDYDLVRHRLEREPTRRCRLCFDQTGRQYQ